jgi:GTP cyclohydrolase IA
MPDRRSDHDHSELEARVRQIVDRIEQGDEEEEVELGIPREPMRKGSRPDHPVEGAVHDILVDIGEDPAREGLARTPERMHRMWHELTAGYQVDAEKLINGAIFDVGYSEMVVIKGIPFYSLCEHHMLPFFGTVGVGYLPKGKVVGLSKIPRVVEMYARRLQVQERMTQQIAEFLMNRLSPYGVGVVVEAEHLCLAMRGVQKGGATMVTSSVLGTFRSIEKTREEFLAHLQRPEPRA